MKEPRIGWCNTCGRLAWVAVTGLTGSAPTGLCGHCRALL